MTDVIISGPWNEELYGNKSPAMEKSPKISATLKFNKYLCLVAGLILALAYLPHKTFAAAKARNGSAMARDTGLSTEIITQLNNVKDLPLNYPGTVTRFYGLKGYQAVWIKPQQGFGKTWQAMLLLDCVLQYGLSHGDYHPTLLIYDKLHELLEFPEKSTASEKARFEIILTDALVTMINHLHFGKLNPTFPADRIDNGQTGDFHAEAALSDAMGQENFMTAIADVQPHSKLYRNMQDHMRLLAGERQADCYEIPPEVIRKMAINLERMRWYYTDEKTYIQINIPSFTLIFKQPDTVYKFKVIVGKPDSPTPMLQSTINYFTTAPEWKVPKTIFIKEILPKATRDTAYLDNNHYAIYDKKGKYVAPSPAAIARVKQNPAKYYARQSSGCDNALGLIVFRFQNIYDVFLHDTPQQELFGNEQRAFSHSCIRVEHAEKLAGLLLRNDGAAAKLPSMRQALEIYQTKNFMLKKPVPILITYLTCEVRQGLLIDYKDVYDLDKSLEAAMYNTDEPLTMK